MQPEMLKGLLQLLHEDEAEAAEEYRKLHQRLVRFFDWNSVDDPYTLADVAIDRLAKRVSEVDPAAAVEAKPGRSAARVTNAFSFALGIARHLLQEEARRRMREAELGRHLQAEAERTRPSVLQMERSLEDALRDCLSRLPKERRELIEAYYNYGEQARGQVHESLAARLGLSLNALRNRALRSRQDLEACIRGGLRDE